MTPRAAAALVTLAIAIALGIGLTLTLVPNRADAASVPVIINYQSFYPGAIDALPGDAITWSNHGGRTHTVTSDDAMFDSGDVLEGGQFTWSFTAPGMYMYHCAIHRGMVGEVDVRLVTLDPVPSRAIAAGTQVDLQGRAADASGPVTIERDAGDGFVPVATASPHADGGWQATVAAAATAQYRAAVAGGVSETRRLPVIERQVRVHFAHGHLSVWVVPKAPRARVALQFYLRDRFGWWPARRARLDSASRTRFAIDGPVRARVALLGHDGWTALALSHVVHVRRR